MERTLLIADHLAIYFEVISKGAVSSVLKGELRLATGNKLDLVAVGTFAGRDVDLKLRSDGTRLTGGNGVATLDVATPKDLNKAVTLGLTRMGLLHNLALLSRAAVPDHSNGGVTDWVTVDSHSDADGNGVTFDISVSGQKVASATMTLRGDALPRHRTQTVRFSEGVMTVSERYSSITIDGPVDSSRFTHP